ncbi:MAG: hypothetical protein ABJO09_00930 [Hyphomicrobiales bacterium]
MADIFAPGATPNTTTRPNFQGSGTPGDTWFQTGASCADSTPIMPDFLNFLSANMRQAVRASATPDALDDPRMLAETMARYATGGVVARQTGIGNTPDEFNLAPLGTFYGATGYFHGMVLQFVPTTTNVAAGSTLVRYGTILPYKKVLDFSGTDLIAADFTAGYPVTLRYNINADGGNGAFILDPWSSPNFSNPAPVLSEEYQSPNFLMTQGGFVTLAHGLSSIPKLIMITCVNIVADNGYQPGDSIEVNIASNSIDPGTGEGFAVRKDSANIYMRVGNDTFDLISYVNGNKFDMRHARWEAYLRAFA